LKKFLFVINPKAGVKSKQNIDLKIKKWLGKEVLAEFLWWENADLDITTAISKRISLENFDGVIAVGGDGTVNRTATALLNSKISFGILPIGSGNALARHLKIPVNLPYAAHIITNYKSQNMDSCTLNDKHFFCAAGTGFDAYVGNLFANARSRGFSTYIKIAGKEFRKYKPLEYRIKTDGKEICRKAFLVTVANTNQYGNNAYIAPQADINDGFMNVVILKPFGLIHAPALAGRLFLKNIHKSPLVETIKAKEVDIYREEPGSVHFDGEPAIMQKELCFRIFPNSLKIIVP